MESLLTIHSNASNRKLIFSRFDGEYFYVELKGFEVSAIAKVSVYTDEQGLSNFFQELGYFEFPWQTLKSWVSIEQDFQITASCNALGSVNFLIELRGLQGAPEAWKVEAGLTTEFGQLEYFARDAKEFFKSKHKNSV